MYRCMCVQHELIYIVYIDDFIKGIDDVCVCKWRWENLECKKPTREILVSVCNICMCIVPRSPYHLPHANCHPPYRLPWMDGLNQDNAFHIIQRAKWDRPLTSFSSSYFFLLLQGREKIKNDDDVIVQEKNENTVRMHALTNMHKMCFGRAYVAHGRSTFSSLLLGTQLKRHVKWHAILHHNMICSSKYDSHEREKKEKRMIFIHVVQKTRYPNEWWMKMGEIKVCNGNGLEWHLISTQRECATTTWIVPC